MFRSILSALALVAVMADSRPAEACDYSNRSFTAPYSMCGTALQASAYYTPFECEVEIIYSAPSLWNRTHCVLVAEGWCDDTCGGDPDADDWDVDDNSGTIDIVLSCDCPGYMQPDFHSEIRVYSWDEYMYTCSCQTDCYPYPHALWSATCH